MSCFHSQIKTSHGALQKDSPPPPPPPPSSNNNCRVVPAVLFVIVILAAISIVSGLLHLLLKLLIKNKNPSSSSPSHSDHTDEEALQRQLRQLFHLHDSGLDQASIDALPVFLYREILGSKEPFDCAVCLCEFLQDDELRLLPTCSHAFHVDCIDTWLLSSSTCPLCRGVLFVQGGTLENPMLEFEEVTRLEEGRLGDQCEVEEIGSEKRLVPVRLGKFHSTSKRDDDDDDDDDDGIMNVRRCYSMESYEYVVGDANLLVALNIGGRAKGAVVSPAVLANEEGQRLSARSKGESFSVSKIWLWRNDKRKFAGSSDAVARKSEEYA